MAVIDNSIVPYLSSAVQNIFKFYLRDHPGASFIEFYDSYWGATLDVRKESEVQNALNRKEAAETALRTKQVNDQFEENQRKSAVARQKTYTSFSGADIVASIRPDGGKPIIFGEIQTISYSIYRPMQPVYTLGRINPKGIVRGQRTIAGSLIFTVFDRHVLKNVMDNYKNQEKSFRDSFGLSADDIMDLRNYAKTDEMPPFDINISFLNEYGNSATLNIYGIHIMSEGQTMSIEDMITENTMQYIAMDIDLMDYGAGADYDTEL